MEKALRYELNKINEINNKIYPTNAPEGKAPPFLVYFLSGDKRIKTLEGRTKSAEASYLLNILAGSYSEMKSLTEKVEDAINSFLETEIGAASIYVEDLTIHDIAEQYEHELKLYRGIIDVTFYYEEV